MCEESLILLGMSDKSYSKLLMGQKLNHSTLDSERKSFSHVHFHNSHILPKYFALSVKWPCTTEHGDTQDEKESLNVSFSAC